MVKISFESASATSFKSASAATILVQQIIRGALGGCPLLLY